MIYELSQRHYFRENGQTLLPGQTIDLTEEQAAEHNKNIPGLLRPTRLTTQAHPASIRTAEPIADEPTPEKPKRKK